MPKQSDSDFFYEESEKVELALFNLFLPNGYQYPKNKNITRKQFQQLVNDLIGVINEAEKAYPVPDEQNYSKMVL